MSQPSVIFNDVKSWHERRRLLKVQGKRFGFVPTMGALHAGHLSLLERAKRENELSVLSIYVNPTQFDNPSDLAKYPATLEQDKKLARQAGVDFILLPTFEQIYPDGFSYRVSERGLSEKLCGANRPGHFEGVLTVVLKLLNLIQADKAYFGEKDFQQLELIRGMVRAFFLSTEIVACKTVREPDGLAMSSRNLNLSIEARAIAPQFFQALKQAATASEAKAHLKLAGFQVDYIEDIQSRRYGAAWIGGVRLIDNVER